MHKKRQSLGREGKTSTPGLTALVLRNVGVIDRRDAALGRADRAARIILALHNAGPVAACRALAVRQRKTNTAHTVGLAAASPIQLAGALQHSNTTAGRTTTNDTDTVQQHQTVAARWLFAVFHNNISQGTATTQAGTAAPASGRAGRPDCGGTVALFTWLLE